MRRCILAIVCSMALCACSSGTSFEKMVPEDTTIRVSECLYYDTNGDGVKTLQRCDVHERDISEYVDRYANDKESEYYKVANELLENDYAMVETITSKLVNLKECDGVANRNSLLFRLENEKYWVFSTKIICLYKMAI